MHVLLRYSSLIARQPFHRRDYLLHGVRQLFVAIRPVVRGVRPVIAAAHKTSDNVPPRMRLGSGQVPTAFATCIFAGNKGVNAGDN